MSNSSNFNFPASAYLYPILLILTIWIAFWLEQSMGIRLRGGGVQPRTLTGLKGILFSPFLHGSMKHIISNSLPLLVLTVALFYFYRGLAFPVLIFGWILTGFLTWLIGREGSVHIGASGIVYLLASFLFFKGIWSKNARLISVALIVVFLYGSLIWGIFPNEPRISWEGHLSGFISGIALAFYYKNFPLQIEQLDAPVKRPVSRREIEFLKHFDEDGNFIPASEWEKRNAPTDATAEVEVVYKFIKEEEKPQENL